MQPQSRNSQRIQVSTQQQSKRFSLQQPQQTEQEQQEQITQQTVDRFNKICVQATQLMNEYKNQSMSLKYEIADMVSIYQKNSANTTDAVPVQKIISITNEYEFGMREANKEYHHLQQQLRQQEKQRDQMMFQIKDCFQKLERMQVKLKQKRKREQQEKKKLQQGDKNQQEKKEQNEILKPQESVQQPKPSIEQPKPQSSQNQSKPLQQPKQDQ